MTSSGIEVPDVAAPAQYRGTVRYGPELRVLIVGGGVAGLTLAALLEQRGFAPSVVERCPDGGDEGYVVGLWPAGSRILKGLKLYSKFCDDGVACSHYIIANSSGDTLNSFSCEPLARQYGPLVALGRPQLMALLRSAVDERHIRLGVALREINETSQGVVATFDNGTAELFDVVVACDGIHSSVRQLVFGDAPIEYSGVAGWAFWLPPDFVPPPEVVEYWGGGMGKFIGMYPARRQFCAIAAIQSPPDAPDPVDTRLDRMRNAFADFGGIIPWVLGELPEPERMLRIDFADIHVDEWVRGRVVLLGDAAHAIFPMMGMGASLALESAAVLTEELCRTDSKFLARGLRQYTARRRPRVDRVQAQSRRLGRVVFAGHGLVRRLRDRALRIVSDEPVLDTVDAMLSEQI
jgi:2-polyprenyl-6-methoxyphenol hydroxylase-like FAD-dependent oxidoreductase